MVVAMVDEYDYDDGITMVSAKSSESGNLIVRGETNEDYNSNGSSHSAIAVPCSSEPLLEQLGQARRWIYVSHFFSQFSDASWQFALSLFLAAFSNYQSLFLISSYGIVSQLSICAFGSISGRYVDETSSHRLRTARLFLGTQTLCVLIATTCSYYALHRVDHIMMISVIASSEGNTSTVVENHEQTEPSESSVEASHPWSKDIVTIVLVLLIHLFGPLAEILNRGFLVAIERDWIVTMMPAAPKARPIDDNDDNSLDSNSPDDRTSTGQERSGREWLVETNVRMKQLDLTCKVVAPAVSGLIVGSFDDASSSSEDNPQEHNSVHNLTTAALLVGLVHVAAVIVEYVATAHVYYMVPALRGCQVSKTPATRSTTESTARTLALTESEEGIAIHSRDERETEGTSDSEVEENDSCLSRKLSNHDASVGEDSHFDDGENENLIVDSCEMALNSPSPSSTRENSSSLSSSGRILLSGWTIFFQQPIAFGGLGLALLYVNILNFSALMTAFLVSKGMALQTVGVLRGTSAALGLLGTVAYDVSVKSTSLVTTGLWSIVFEFMCLSVCFASFFVPSYIGSMALLVAGVWASRIGLWVFDISISQMMQELIPEGIRGVVGGTQQSLNAFFQFIPYVMGLIFYQPAEFHIYAATGYLAVGIAMILYFVGVYQRADRLFPESGG